MTSECFQSKCSWRVDYILKIVFWHSVFVSMLVAIWIFGTFDLNKWGFLRQHGIRGPLLLNFAAVCAVWWKECGTLRGFQGRESGGLHMDCFSPWCQHDECCFVWGIEVEVSCLGLWLPLNFSTGQPENILDMWRVREKLGTVWVGLGDSVRDTLKNLERLWGVLWEILWETLTPWETCGGYFDFEGICKKHRQKHWKPCGIKTLIIYNYI